MLVGGAALVCVLVLYVVMYSSAAVVVGGSMDWYDDPGAPGSPGDVFDGGQVGYDGYCGEESFSCVAPAVRCTLTDKFGVPRPPYMDHGGIDYGTCYDYNVGVITPMGGKVVYAAWSSVGYGYLVVVENCNWQVFLAHNNSFLVEEGDIVQAGDIVALSGSTGNSNGPHVHFETRHCWMCDDPDYECYCSVVDPNDIKLPGQSSSCSWYNIAPGCSGE